MVRLQQLSTILARAQRAWRASLQLRVVTITLATSGVLVATFGIIVGNMITTGLLESKAANAKVLAEGGSQKASDQIKALISSPREPKAPADLQWIASTLANQDQGSRVDVAILPADASVPLEGVSWPGVNTYQNVPAQLQSAVREHGFVSQRLELDLDGRGGRLYLVFGRQLEQAWGGLQIYYFFPLTEEVAFAALVGNTITITGLSLVVMLALVAALVTRMVVRPVRVAARTAQRLSNGLLDQRMEVKGEDDLAALAASFNQMAESLQRHILRLEEMSRLQRRFSSDVSHELRTPLTTVRMAADLIFSEREHFAPPVARSAELLQAELNRFEALLTELLEISRFDAGFAVLEAEPADLGQLVRRIADRLAPLAERAGVRIDVELPAQPVLAEVDVRRVERILRNLIGNAVEHGEGKPVRVRLAARAGAAAIAVRDYGVGLKPGEEKLVFNRFWRADPARARHTGGTGLGLSISTEDARLHGGWLEAWGALGQGAQFRLTLPVRGGDRLTSSPLPLVPTDFRPPALAALGNAEREPAEPAKPVSAPAVCAPAVSAPAVSAPAASPPVAPAQHAVSPAPGRSASRAGQQPPPVTVAERVRREE